MATATTALLRDRLELILSIPAGDAYIDSTPQLQDLNIAYERTAYKYDWPQMLLRSGIVVVANVDRYAVPSGFRRARYVRVKNLIYEETELDVLKDSYRKYAIDKGLTTSSDIVLSNLPSTASTAYTLSNAESAGSAVTIELNSVSGLSQGDEIFVDSASGTDEFTTVSSVDSTNTTITARLKYAKSAGDILYLVKEIIDIYHYRNITLLSAASDTTILPDETDYLIPHYAAYLSYFKLEQFDKAKENFDLWDRGTKEAFLSADKNSSGEVTSFSIF